MNVVYLMTRNVYEWAVPSIRSLAAHNPEARVFMLIEDDSFPYELPIPVEVINVKNQSWFGSDGVNIKNDFGGYINFLKVCYPDLLPVDKVLHLDIDAMVCDDLTPLWETDMSGKWFGMVREYLGTTRPFGFYYYNAGVLLMNLEQMRKDGISPKMVDYLNNTKVRWVDQDCFNYYGLTNDKIVPLDVRWNESRVTGTTPNPGIVHYCSYADWWTKQDMPRKEILDHYR